MFKRTTKVSLAELIKEGIRGDLLNLHTSMPGKVKIYYKDEQKADIIPLIKKKYKNNNNEVEISVIQDVPVYCLSCNNGDTFIHMPIKEGDLVFRIYSENQSKLKRAEKIYNSTGGPIVLGGMMIERI